MYPASNPARRDDRRATTLPQSTVSVSGDWSAPTTLAKNKHKANRAYRRGKKKSEEGSRKLSCRMRRSVRAISSASHIAVRVRSDAASRAPRGSLGPRIYFL